MSSPEQPDFTAATYGEVGRQALVAAGSALAAGIASLTFVAVVGGAVTMARLRGAGLPTEFGVAVQPRPMLLAVGAEALAAAIAFAMAALFTVHFLIWVSVLVPTGAGSARHSSFVRWLLRQRFVRWLLGRRFVRWLLGQRFVRWLLRQCQHTLAVLVVLLGFGYYIVWSAGALHFPFQAGVASLMLLFAVVAGYVAGRLAAKAVRARDSRHNLPDDPADIRRPERDTSSSKAQRAEHARLARVEITYLGGLAATILLYATVATVTASLADPKVRPAAVLFAEHRVPLCGIFVAQDSEHLYIGLAEKGPLPNVGDHGKGRILDLPRREVRALNVGTSQSLPDALDHRRALMDDLARLHGVSVPAASSRTCP